MLSFWTPLGSHPIGIDMTAVNSEKLSTFVNQFWDDNITPTLEEYIKIPNKSPDFDPNWDANGHMEAALQLTLKWLEAHEIPGMKIHVGRLPERTPMLIIEVDGTIDKTVVLYGHLDKQPEMEGWREDLGPWKPVLEDGKLYGRGGADDGYAVFASICAIKAVQEQGLPHARCVLFIEFSEESGSPDLPPYLVEYENLIGIPEAVICLDSGAGNYDQLWATTNLRGMLCGTLTVEVLKEGVHSGTASGIVPSSFRIMRQLLARVENGETGKILLPELHVDIPQQRIDQAQKAADVLGDTVYSDFTFPDGMQPVDLSPKELLLNGTWRPTLSIVGMDGVPSVEQGGNVLRPYTTIKWSFRLPPTLPVEQAEAAVVQMFTEDVPYGAQVTVDVISGASGWNANELAPWMEELFDETSKEFFGKEAMFYGLGGTIPFMHMLGDRFPEAQFIITGVLGPKSNAHGPNEFIHLDYAKKLTAGVAFMLAKHGQL